MGFDRRDFLNGVAAGAVASGLPSPRGAMAAAPRRLKAVAFDAFPVFDPRPIFALSERLYPGKGMELGNAWRTRQFEYQWLRTLSGHFADFLQTTQEALVFSARSLKLELTPEKRAQLMRAWLDLRTWPDAPAALKSLKEAGLRLAFCSNMTASMLEKGIADSGLDGLFEHVLSTDRVKAHKPDPRAYRMAVDAFGLERDEILFVSFAGWDAAGAKWFGYPTYWVNRLGLPAEELGVTVDAAGRDLAQLVAFVQPRR